MKTLTKDELRKIQLLELKILKEIKRICTKHDIKYFLTGGTLLGAVRHKGFIPWDDDIDIAMLRSEYDRFIEVAPKELSSEFEFISIEINPEYAGGGGKVLLRNTIFRTAQQPKNFEKCGIFVDVIPYDNAPDSILKLFLNRSFIQFMTVLYALKVGYRNGTTPFKAFVAKVMYIGFLFVPKSIVRKYLLHFPSLFSQLNCKNKIFFNGRYPLKRELHPIGQFSSYSEIEFEGEPFFVLTDYDAFLKILYGKNYIQPPPKTEQYAHPIVELDFGGY